jgi:hypothetical protein
MDGYGTRRRVPTKFFLPQECFDHVLDCLSRKRGARHTRVICSEEHHANGGKHFHVVISFEKRTLLKPDHFKFTLRSVTYRPNMSSRRTVKDATRYVCKEDKNPLLDGITQDELNDEIKAKENHTTAFYEQCLRTGKITKEQVMNCPKILPKLSQVEQGLRTFNSISRQESNMKDIQEQDKLEEMYAWQAGVVDIVNGTPDQRKIHWYWSEEGGMGKTSMALYLDSFHDTFYCTGGSMRDLACAWQQQRIIIFDMTKSSVLDDDFYSNLEQFKNGAVFSSKYNSGMKRSVRPHVIVFANTAPDATKMTDRFITTELRQGTLHFTKVPNSDPKMTAVFGTANQPVTSQIQTSQNSSTSSNEDENEDDEDDESETLRTETPSQEDDLYDSDDDFFDYGTEWESGIALVRCDAIRQEDLDSNDEATSQNAGEDHLPPVNDLTDVMASED